MWEDGYMDDGVAHSFVIEGLPLSEFLGQGESVTMDINPLFLNEVTPLFEVVEEEWSDPRWTFMLSNAFRFCWAN